MATKSDLLEAQVGDTSVEELRRIPIHNIQQDPPGVSDVVTGSELEAPKTDAAEAAEDRLGN